MSRTKLELLMAVTVVALLLGGLMALSPGPAGRPAPQEARAADPAAQTSAEGSPEKPQEDAADAGDAGPAPDAKPRPDKTDAQRKTPTHKQAVQLGVTKGTRLLKPRAMRVNADGNLLVADAGAKRIRILTPEDKPVADWKLPFQPESLAVAPDGEVYVGGRGRVARLSAKGEMLKEYRVKGEKLRTQRAISVAAGKKDVFICFTYPYKVYRCGRDFSDGEKIIEKLRGCCSTLDIALDGDVLVVAQNGRHRVERYDRTGKKLATWGKYARGDRIDTFGGCCNPMNICVTGEGDVLTSQSGGQIARFTRDGTFEQFLGRAKQPSGCKRVPVDTSPDGKTLYVLDTYKKRIAVLRPMKDGGGEKEPAE